MKSLTNVIFKNSKRLDKYKTKKEAFLATIAFSIVFLFISGIMVFFSYSVTTQLIEINQTYAFVNILLLINFFILFTKSIFESLNVLYFSKDLRILLRMPIKSINIVHAKFLNMIFSEYQMEIIMLAIPMMVYGIITKANFLFYLYMVIILLFIPIIPILITSLVISIIMRFTNFIKNKNKVMYITIIFSIFLISLIMGIFNNQHSMSINIFKDIILRTNGLAESIAEYFVLIKPIMNTLLNFDNIEGLKNLILYIIENIFFYIIVLYIISKIYLKGAIGVCINSTKNSKKEFEELTKKDFRRKKVTKAYLIKEMKTMIRTPIFFIQCIIIPILDPIAMFLIVLGLVKFAEIVGLNLWEKLYDISSTTFGSAVFLGVGQVFYMMNFSSIIGISRDSNNAIMLKYIPIEFTKQFNLKICMGILVNSISTVLVTIFYYLCVHNLLFSVILFLELIYINLIGEKIKLLIDLNKPQLKWDNEYTMMKQNTNIMYELFYTLIICLSLFIISKFIMTKLVFLTILGIVLVVINYFINKYIENKKYDIFGKIY